MTSSTLGYSAPGRRTARRIPVRMIVFLVVMIAPFAAILYGFLDGTRSGGIHHHGKYDDVDLKAMGYFEFDEMANSLDGVPAKWRNLDGKRVALEGFMWAPDAASNSIRDFQFVYSISKCCFGGPPRVQERVFAHVPDNVQPVPYYADMARIVGVLHVKLEKEPATGKVIKLYTIDVDEAGKTS